MQDVHQHMMPASQTKPLPASQAKPTAIKQAKLS